MLDIDVYYFYILKVLRLCNGCIWIVLLLGFKDGKGLKDLLFGSSKVCSRDFILKMSKIDYLMLLCCFCLFFFVVLSF